jgi:plasmid stabilization system protein ParE
MKLVVIRPAFWLDVDRHHYWLTKHLGPDLAARWLAALWQTVRFLYENPEVGRVRTDLEFPGVRSWLVHEFRRWTIFYGIQEQSLVLYRVEGGETNLRGLVIG